MLAAQRDIVVRHRLLDRMSEARRHSDAIFGLVRHGSIYERPIPERHRIIFYLGHLEAFDWNLLQDRVLGRGSFHPEFDRLFAFGIDPVGGGLPSDQPSDWPSVDTVRDYVAQVRSALDEKLSHSSLESAASANERFSLETLLNVAIEHRLMHVETLSYMLHQLPYSSKVPHLDAPSVVSSPVNYRMVEIPEGSSTLGLSRSAAAFGWDNEYDAHSVEVPRFEIDQYKVTNGQFLDFMTSGGYENRAFWGHKDWAWKAEQGIAHPIFWEQVNNRWRLRTMFEEIALPLDWPVYVSHAEASAYARWAGKQLPTEEEWHRAAYGTPEGNERPYPWGVREPAANLGNFDFHHWNPASVNAFPQGRSTFEVEGMVGNGWEWTSTVFAPFGGFEPFPFYRGYSADFFDGKHFVMKGGSSRTAACMLRPTFRNWFQPHYQYVYAGFRCVKR